MKTTELISKVEKLLKKKPDQTELKKLCKTVKALKHKQKDLEQKLKKTEGKHARKRVQHKIDALRLQRRKGYEIYQKIKAKRKK